MGLFSFRKNKQTESKPQTGIVDLSNMSREEYAQWFNNILESMVKDSRNGKFLLLCSRDSFEGRVLKGRPSEIKQMLGEIVLEHRALHSIIKELASEIDNDQLGKYQQVGVIMPLNEGTIDQIKNSDMSPADKKRHLDMQNGGNSNAIINTNGINSTDDLKKLLSTLKEANKEMEKPPAEKNDARKNMTKEADKVAEKLKKVDGSLADYDISDIIKRNKSKE